MSQFHHPEIFDFVALREGSVRDTERLLTSGIDNAVVFIRDNTTSAFCICKTATGTAGEPKREQGSQKCLLHPLPWHLPLSTLKCFATEGCEGSVGASSIRESVGPCNICWARYRSGGYSLYTRSRDICCLARTTHVVTGLNPSVLCGSQRHPPLCCGSRLVHRACSTPSAGPRILYQFLKAFEQKIRGVSWSIHTETCNMWNMGN